MFVAMLLMFMAIFEQHSVMLFDSSYEMITIHEYGRIHRRNDTPQTLYIFLSIVRTTFNITFPHETAHEQSIYSNYLHQMCEYSVNF